MADRLHSMENLNNSYALIIGVGDDLPYTVKDANNLYQTLIDQERVGFPKENVIVLTDKQANRKNILDAFDDLKKKTDEDSTILFYYSGHGGRLDGHKFFLQPYGVTLENYKKTVVYADELKDKINALPSDKLVLFLDCCHAEGMIQTGIEGLYGMAQKLNDDHGVWVMASCQDDQKSYGAGDESFFTQCLLEVMSGQHKRPFTDPEVSIMDVVEYIFEEVPKRAAEYVDENDNPCIQTPFFKTQMSENIILSHFPKNVEDYESIIADLEPKLKELDENHFLKLVDAFEAVGKRERAMDILRSHKEIDTDPDLQEKLGELHRNLYLVSNLKKDGENALGCFRKAFQLATEKQDEEQVFTTAVKIAFMYAKLDLDKEEMRSFAKKAREAALLYFYPIPNKWATIAEAAIYLNLLEESREYFLKLSEKAGIRHRMQCYDRAASIYKLLFQPKDAKDPFLVFLEETLLS